MEGQRNEVDDGVERGMRGPKRKPKWQDWKGEQRARQRNYKATR